MIVASHSLHMMAEMCDRVLWLERGIVRELGPADAVVEAYTGALTAAAG